MTKPYKIAEIAKLTGLSIPTLRYYEELGLLRPARDSNNYRIFTDSELHWIAFIKRAKATGMSLAKIIDYAKLREQGSATIHERIAILDQQEQLLLMEQQKLQAHIDFLQNKKRTYSQLLASKEKTE